MQAGYRLQACTDMHRPGHGHQGNRQLRSSRCWREQKIAPHNATVGHKSEGIEHQQRVFSAAAAAGRLHVYSRCASEKGSHPCQGKLRHVHDPIVGTGQPARVYKLRRDSTRKLQERSVLRRWIAVAFRRDMHFSPCRQPHN